LLHDNCTTAHQYLHPLPTRRSSDLKNTTNRNASNAPRPSKSPIDETIGSVDVHDKIKPTLDKIDADTPIEKIFFINGLLHCSERSEEHTSELQSRFDLVCRLLLEKK